MQRVMIVGGPGSGKSTLARALGARTGLPVVHVDRIHWLPNWVERPKEEKLRLAHAEEVKPAWIFEGSLTATWPHRARRADTLIWLDLNVYLRLWRVTKRIFQHYGQSRPDLTEGCREAIRWDTLAFYRFIWRTRHTRDINIQTLIDEHPHLKVHHLKGRASIAQFLATFE